MNIYLFFAVIITILLLFYLYHLEISSQKQEGFKNKEKDMDIKTVLQNDSKISTQTTCNPNADGICYIDGMPKKIVDTVIANVVEDEHYKTVFKKIRSYTPSNIYQCIGKTNPMMSMKPLNSF